LVDIRHSVILPPISRPIFFAPPPPCARTHLRKHRGGCSGLSHVTRAWASRDTQSGHRLTGWSHGHHRRHNAQDGFPFGNPPSHPTPNHSPPHWYAGGASPSRGRTCRSSRAAGIASWPSWSPPGPRSRGWPSASPTCSSTPPSPNSPASPPPPHILFHICNSHPSPATAFGGRSRTPPPNHPSVKQLTTSSEIHHRRSVGGGAASAFVARATAENAPAAATPEDPEPEGDVPLSPAHAPSLPPQHRWKTTKVSQSGGTGGPAH